MSSFYLGITECSMLGLFVERHFIPQIDVFVFICEHFQVSRIATHRN